MMRLVIDANIVFAALLRDGITAKLLVHPALELFAPDLFLNELEKYRTMIQKRTNRDAATFEKVLEIFRSRIQIVEIAPERVREMLNDSPDPGDAPYLALAAALGIPLWTMDKALSRQRRVQIYSTEELLRRI